MAGRLSSTPAAFAAGFSFSLVACTAVLAQRISHGAADIAFASHVVLTMAVLVVAAASERFEVRIPAQVAGGLAGIVLAHALLRTSPSMATHPWLDERPAQLVNDAVAVFAPLAVVWASSRRPPSTRILVATLLTVTAYRVTAPFWHLDVGVFQHTVQDLVTMELGCAALAIAAFRMIVPARC